MKSTYYVAASLDGFIADPAGGVDWLDNLGIDHAGSSLEAFYASVDGLLMGRATYDFVFDHGSWPYGDLPAWVVTSSALQPLAGANLHTSEDPADAVRQARDAGVKHLWIVGGGKIAAALLQQRLIDTIHVTVMPVLLGEGIPLVGELPSHLFLTQERTQAGGGFIEVVYRVASDG